MIRNIALIIMTILSFVSVRAEERADSLLMQYLRSQGLVEYNADDVKVYTNGTDKFNAMFRDMHDAKKTIDVEYFIFADDSIAHLTLDVMKDAVKRGVRVRLIIDGYKDHERDYGYDGPRIDSLRKEGIEAYIFDQWKHPYLSHVPRDHKKIVVIDNEIGYIGGLNVADYYINGKPEVYGGWRDTHVRISGDAAKGMTWLFEKALYIAKNGIDKEKDVNLYISAERGSVSNIENTDCPKVVYFERSRESKKKKAETRNAIIEAFNSAQDTLRIVSPYLLPTHTVRMALVKAVDRGVNVQVLFSIDGDQPILSVGNYHFSKRLIRHGAEVYLYRGAFHHSKIMMIDGMYSMVGSANLNSRSLKWDYEASCFVFDKNLTEELNSIFESDKLQSDKLTKEYYKKIPFRKRLYGWFVDRFLTPIL